MGRLGRHEIAAHQTGRRLRKKSTISGRFTSARCCRRPTFRECACASGAGGALLPNDFEMEPVKDKTWPLADRGLALLPDSKLIKAKNVVDALGMGLHRTWSSLRQICQGLVSMAAGRISVTKNLQGPLDIAEMTFEAARDPFNLILILGIISINLAVMNFLPIPVLDGGHMVFLVYELVRRKPPSDAVRAVATYIGLAFLCLLMLFAFYLTFSRWGWFGGR